MSTVQRFIPAGYSGGIIGEVVPAPSDHRWQALCRRVRCWFVRNGRSRHDRWRMWRDTLFPAGHPIAAHTHSSRRNRDQWRHGSSPAALDSPGTL